MRYSEIVKLWEDGWRGKFKNKFGTLYECKDIGIYCVYTNDCTNCINMILGDTYEIIKEPKKVTFEEAFTNKEYLGKEIYPECDIETPFKATRIHWLYYFYKNYHVFSKAIKSMWIVGGE